MASDWGSAYANQPVNYVIALRNNRAVGGANYTNLRLLSELPSNLEIVSARADRGGDPKITGNSVAFQIATLAPQQGVEIVIATKVKSAVATGTTIVSQAALSADGLLLTAYSNVVSLLVVGAPVQQATATTAATPTGTATVATAGSTASAGATATTAATAALATPTVATTAATNAATPTSTSAAVGSAGGTTGSSTLPATGAGVPLLGFALLGMTMMVRTVRLHRAQSRV